MLLCASDGPQPYPSSDKDSTRSQSAEAALQSVRVKIPLVLANVTSPPWKVFITAITFFLHDVSEQGSCLAFSYGEKLPVTAWSSSSFLVTPIRSLGSVMT